MSVCRVAWLAGWLASCFICFIPSNRLVVRPQVVLRPPPRYDRWWIVRLVCLYPYDQLFIIVAASKIPSMDGGQVGCMAVRFALTLQPAVSATPVGSTDPRPKMSGGWASWLVARSCSSDQSVV